MDKVSLVNLDNRALQTIAIKKAEHDTNYSKKHKICQGIVLATPIAAGIAAAALSPKYLGQAVVNSKTTKNLLEAGVPVIKGAAARLINGAKSFLTNAAYLGAGFLAFEAKDKLVEKSDKAKEFDKKHGFLATLGTLVAAVGIAAGARKGVSALVGKIKPETFKMLAGKARAFNKSNFVANLSEKAGRLAGKMGPKTKTVISKIVSWTPTAMVYGGIAGLLANNFNYANKASQNYSELKELQYQQAMAEVNGTI